MKKHFLAAILMAVGASTFAQTTSSPFSLQIGASRTHMNYDCVADTCKTYDLGHKLTAAYRLNQNLAAEVAYLDYGKSYATDSSGTEAKVEVSGWQLGAAYSYPFARNLRGVVRGGLAYNTTVASLKNGSGESGFATENKTSLYLGVGAEFRLHESASLFAEYNLSNANDGLGENVRVQMLSGGVKLDF